MKTIFLLLFVLFLFAACEQTSHDTAFVGEAGGLVFHSDCKLKSGKAVLSNAESCVEYEFVECCKTLKINHINAGFNCCPDSMYCEVFVVDDTIRIVEHETMPMCHCNCLYDLNIQVNNLERKAYVLQFVEPYAQEQTPLIFVVNLKESPSGSRCVSRTLYPWGGE